MAKTPVAEQVQVNFRMPVELRDRIKAAAEISNRSMNAEIVATLEKAYPALTGIEATVERINRLVSVARELDAVHLLNDLSLDLERTLADEAKENSVLRRLLAPKD